MNLILQGLKNNNYIIQGLKGAGATPESGIFIPTAPGVDVILFEKGHRVTFPRWPAFQRFCVPITDKQKEELDTPSKYVDDSAPIEPGSTYWWSNYIDVIAEGLYLYGKDFKSDGAATFPQYISAALYVENGLNVIICRPFEVPFSEGGYQMAPEDVVDLYNADSENLDDDTLSDSIDTETDPETDATAITQRTSLTDTGEPVEVSFSSKLPLGPNPFFTLRIWRQAPAKDETQAAEERSNAYGTQFTWGLTATDGWRLNMPIGGDAQLYRWVKDATTNIYAWKELLWTQGSLNVSGGSMDKEPIRLYFGVIQGALCVGTENFDANNFAWYRPTGGSILIDPAVAYIKNNTGQFSFVLSTMKMFPVTLEQIFYAGISECDLFSGDTAKIIDHSTMCNPYAYSIVRDQFFPYEGNTWSYKYEDGDTAGTRLKEVFNNSDIPSELPSYDLPRPEPGQTHFFLQYSSLGLNDDYSVYSNWYTASNKYIAPNCVGITVHLEPLSYIEEIQNAIYIPGCTTPGVSAISLYARVDATVTTVEELVAERTVTNINGSGESHLIEIEIDTPEESGVQTARMILDNKNNDYSPAIGSPGWAEIGDMRIVRLARPGWWWKQAGSNTPEEFVVYDALWTDFLTAEAEWTYPTVSIGLVDILGPASLIKNIGQFPPGGGWNLCDYLHELFESNFYPPDVLTFEDTGAIIPFGLDPTKPQWMPERGRTLLEYATELLEKVTPGAAIWSARGRIYTGCKYCFTQRTEANWMSHNDNGYRSSGCDDTIGLVLHARPHAGVQPHTVLIDATLSCESLTANKSGNIVDVQGATINGHPLHVMAFDVASFDKNAGSLYTGWPIIYSEESEELTTIEQVSRRALGILSEAGGTPVAPSVSTYAPAKAYYLSGTVLENYLINRGLVIGVTAGDCPDRGIGGNLFRVVACNHGVTRKAESITKFKARWIGPYVP